MTANSAPKWTVETLQVYTEALRLADERFNGERDRRYAEVALEREKALKIKETADLAALQLAREIQTYKDEKANQLREQIGSERGMYASKDDLNAAVREINATIAPLINFSSVSTARGGAFSQGFGWIATVIFVVSSIIGAVIAFLTMRGG